MAKAVRLDSSKRLLLAEALLTITIMSAAIRFLPFRWAVKLGSRRLGVGAAQLPDSIQRNSWAVAAVAARVPWKALCFQQGLTFQRMVRRAGYDARLHYGVGRDHAGSLNAHVWISIDGDVVLGGDTSPSFRQVLVYPSC